MPELRRRKVKTRLEHEEDIIPTRILRYGQLSDGRALKEAFEGTAVVLTPNLPLHPKEALKEVRSIIDREQPDLLLGNSCGSFLTQMLAPVVGIPALLGNPYFMMTEFLKERIGEHEYKAPRRDGFLDGRAFARTIRQECGVGILKP